MSDVSTSTTPPVQAAPEMPGVIDALARMPVQTLLDERALAAALKVTTRTIRRMVGRYELPPGVPLAGRTVWLSGKVLAFLEEKLDRAARDAERRATAMQRHAAS